MLPIFHVRSTQKQTEMSWSIKLGTVYHETRQNNDIIDHTSVVYVENDTELSWLIGPSIVCNENQTGQWRDPLYRFTLRRK